MNHHAMPGAAAIIENFNQACNEDVRTLSSIVRAALQGRSHR